jgi:hypothetical protein
VAEHNAVTDKKVSNTARRAWYGLSRDLERAADAFAEEAGPLPAAYIGTEENTRIGTFLLPATAKLANGSTLSVLIKIPSYTSSLNKIEKGDTKENETFVKFRELLSNPSIAFVEKNAKYKQLCALQDEADTVAAVADGQELEAEAPAEPEVAAEPVVPAPKMTKRQRKAQAAAQAAA